MPRLGTSWLSSFALAALAGSGGTQCVDVRIVRGRGCQGVRWRYGSSVKDGAGGMAVQLS